MLENHITKTALSSSVTGGFIGGIIKYKDARQKIYNGPGDILMATIVGSCLGSAWPVTAPWYGFYKWIEYDMNRPRAKKDAANRR
jgi:hypothetical protein